MEIVLPSSEANEIKGQLSGSSSSRQCIKSTNLTVRFANFWWSLGHLGKKELKGSPLGPLGGAKEPESFSISISCSFSSSCSCSCCRSCSCSRCCSVSKPASPSFLKQARERAAFFGPVQQNRLDHLYQRIKSLRKKKNGEFFDPEIGRSLFVGRNLAKHLICQSREFQDVLLHLGHGSTNWGCLVPTINSYVIGSMNHESTVCFVYNFTLSDLLFVLQNFSDHLLSFSAKL